MDGGKGVVQITAETVSDEERKDQKKKVWEKLGKISKGEKKNVGEKEECLPKK